MVRRAVPSSIPPVSSLPHHRSGMFSSTNGIPAGKADPPINLLRGWPHPSLLPNSSLLVATQRILPDPTLSFQGLEYGPDEGYMPMRKTLAAWLSDFYEPATSSWRKTLPPPSPSRAAPTSSTTRHSAKPAPPTFTGGGVAPPPLPVNAPEARIAITGGASQSLGVLLAALTDPLYTRRIWLVAPAYFLAYKIFQDAGFTGRLRAIPELQSGPLAGPDVAWLRKEMAAVDAECEAEERARGGGPPSFKGPGYKKLYRHVVYTVPSFANPSSLTTTLAAREALVRCAREFDALVVCDDVYDMLQWPVVEDAEELDTGVASGEVLSSDPGSGGMQTGGGTGPGTALLPRLADVDRYLDVGVDAEDGVGEMPHAARGYGNVVSNGSFSKICGPGCRVGWVEAAPPLAFAVSQAGTSKSGGAPSQLTSLFLHDLLTTGALTTHISTLLLPTYARRSTLLLSAIKSHLLPLGASLPQPGREVMGGYFTWVRLPKGVSARRLAERCVQREGVVVAEGGLFEVPGDEIGEGFDGCVRVCWAWEEEDRLVEGVVRVARVLRGMLHGEEDGAGDGDGREGQGIGIEGYA